MKNKKNRSSLRKKSKSKKNKKKSLQNKESTFFKMYQSNWTKLVFSIITLICLSLAIRSCVNTGKIANNVKENNITSDSILKENINQKLKNRTSGILCNKYTPMQPIKLIAGSNNYSFQQSSGIDLTTIIGTDCEYKSPLIVKIKNNKIVITTDIYDYNGEIIARIKDSEWVLNKNNIFQKNYDECGLEIINNLGVPVLSIDLIALNTIRFQGIINCGRGLTIIPENGPTVSISDVNQDSLGNIYKKYRDNFNLIFKYPAENHINQRN